MSRIAEGFECGGKTWYVGQRVVVRTTSGAVLEAVIRIRLDLFPDHVVVEVLDAGGSSYQRGEDYTFHIDLLEPAP